MSKRNSRRQERNVAFQVLYSLSFAEIESLDDVRLAFCQFPHKDQAETPKADTAVQEAQGFAWELVQGVWQNSIDLDALINRFSHNWRIDRMGRVELMLLRLALYEMVYRNDIPAKVAMAEALEISRQFGEESARSFVNGILDAAAKALEAGEIERK